MKDLLNQLNHAAQTWQLRALHSSQPAFGHSCTHQVVFEGDSIAKMYIGNWSDYETMMQDKFGKDLTPHRVKYRVLKR